MKTPAILLAMLMMSNLAFAGNYPLTTCVVSGEKLGEMGPPIVINYKGTEVRFCCDGCPKKFYKDPEKYLAKLKTAPSSH